MTDAILMEKLKRWRGHDDDEEGIDRISELPEHIIHHIMEFLQAEDTTRISILSKKFFSIWCSFPAIDFNFCHLSNPETLKVWDADYVLNSIPYRLLHCRLHKNNCLQRLSFKAGLCGGFQSAWIVEMMIDFALQNQVKEVDLEVVYDEDGGGLEHLYRNQSVKLSCFSEPIFSAKSITSLRLFGFNLRQSQAQPVTLSSPSIEKLSLMRCSGITSITLRGEKLRQASFYDCFGLETIRVDGPTTSLDVLEYSCKNYCDINLASSKSVKSLKIMNTDVAGQWVTSKFCGAVVERLTFKSCSFARVENTRWCFNHLKSLELDNCDVASVAFETPNLEYFRYAGNINWNYPILISSRTIEAMNIQVRMVFGELCWEWYLVYFIHFLARLIHCHTLTIHVSMAEDVIYPTTMRRVLNPPFHDLKHLRIELGEAYKFYRMVELIDSLLWLAPHPNIISFINFDTQTSMKSIKFNYHDAASKDVGDCGLVVDAKWWPQHVKEVELHKFGDVNEVADLKTYFFNFYNISQVVSMN